VLFEELAKLMKYQPALADFPSPITYDDEVRLFADPAKSNLGLSGTT